MSEPTNAPPLATPLPTPTPMSADTRKLTFEFFKHLTTLDTGAIVAMLAIIEKFWPKPLDADSKSVIGWIMMSFVLSLLSSIAMMLYFSLDFEAEKRDRFIGKYLFVVVAFFALSGMGFVVGLLLLLRAIAIMNGIWIPI